VWVCLRCCKLVNLKAIIRRWGRDEGKSTTIVTGGEMSKYSLPILHTHTHTHTLSLSILDTHSHYLSHKCTHTHTPCFSLTHSLFLKHTHTFSLSLTHTLSLSCFKRPSEAHTLTLPGWRSVGTRCQSHLHECSSDGNMVLKFMPFHLSLSVTLQIFFFTFQGSG